MAESTRGVSVTIKNRESERYANDGPWVVFHGTPKEVAEDMAEFYSLPKEEVKDLGPNEIKDYVAVLTQRQHKAITDLDATPVETKSTRKPAAKKAAAKKAAAEPPAEDESTGADAKGSLIKELESAETTKALKSLWAANKSAFKDKDVQAAYSKRGKFLQSQESE